MRHVSRLKSFIWYGTVALLVTLAVLVTVARLTISSASEYRERLEEIAGDYLGQPVTIKSMDARLVGIKPTILLNDVSLREEATNEQLAHFSQIAVALNPLSSLFSLSPVMDLTVQGANIVVIQQLDDSFSLQGVTLSQQAKNTEAGGALGAWFLSQSRLALEGSRVIWRNKKTDREVVFEGVNIELQNLQSRHRLSAEVQLPDELGKELRLALDIQGNLLDRRDWAGEMYVKTVQLKPARWIKNFDVKGFRFQQGSIDLEAWSRWQKGGLESVQGELDLSNLDVLSNDRKLPLDSLAGQFRFLMDKDGWEVNMQKATVREGKKGAVPFRLQLQQHQGVSSVRARNLDIQRLMAFVSQLPGLKSGQRSQLQALKPEGRLKTLRVDLKQGAVLGAVASLKGFKVEAQGKLPGLNGLNANLSFDGTNGEVDIDSRHLALDLPRLFAKKLQLENTQGRIRASRQAGGWKIATKHFAVNNSDIAVSVSMSLQLQPNEVPLISLAGRFQDGRAVSVPDYLPVKIMPDKAVAWLNRAFVAGKVEQGEVLLHGRLEKSLLRNEQGHFEVRFDASEVTLDYMPGWPQIRAINGKARFTGLGMEVDARSARIYQSAVGPTRVRIPRFNQAALELEGNVAASANDALRFVKESPLVDAADDVLAKIEGEGVTPLNLRLSIPLSTKAKQISPLAVDGKVEFRNNRLQVVKGVTLDKVRGELAFNENSFSAQRIDATMYGSPVSMTVFTEKPDQDTRGPTVIAAQGHATAEALRQEFKSPLLESIEGESDWQARLTLTPGDQGGVELDLQSGLDGMAVALPVPLMKEATEKRALSVAIGLAGAKAGYSTLRYGNALKMKLQQDGWMGRLQRMALQFGDESEVRLPEQEVIHISGVLNRFDWRKWHKVMEHGSGGGEKVRLLPLVVRLQRLKIDHAESPADNTTDVIPAIPRIDLLVRDFTYEGMPFGEVALRVEPQEPGLSFEDLSVSAKHFTLRGQGRWLPGGNTALSLKLRSENLGKMLRNLGFASVVSDGETKADVDVHWPGTPLAFSLQRLKAKGHVEIKEGSIKEVKPGAGKLLGLLSIQALPRRLLLDFSDISDEGIQFSSIKGDLEIRDGSAYTGNLLLKSLPADVLITGRTGLVARDFDQLIMVVPNVSDTVSVAGALAWGPQVAAALVLFQKIFKSDIDAATMTRYKVTGSWEKPKIEQLKPLTDGDQEE